MTTDKEFDWPRNLLMDILAVPPPMEPPSDAMPPDFAASTEYVLRTIPDRRDTEIVRMRYEEGLTYAEIGAAFNVSGERVRQKVLKCLRYLRKPAQLRFLLHGVQGVVRGLQEQVWRLESGSAENSPRLDDAPLGVLRLRPRTYNCLLRAELKTVADVLKLSATELLSIRSLGTKALDEIIDALEGHGFNCQHLKQAEESQDSVE